MHLLEAYALDMGTKASRPELATKFFLLPFEKYITVHFSSGMESKNYDLWPFVLRTVIPKVMAAGYGVVQIGGKDDLILDGIPNLHRICGQTDILQSFHVIKNSSLNISNDTFSVHAAGIFNVPIIALYSVSTPAISGPWWFHPNTILLESDRDGKKPSFSAVENPKMINRIGVDEVINAIYQSLGIQDEFKYKPFWTGPKFEFSQKIMGNNSLVEIIPTEKPFQREIKTNNPITIRDDLGDGNNHNLISQLNFMKCVVITEREIDLPVLRHPNIIKILFKVYDKNYQAIRPEYFAELKKHHIPFSLVYDIEINDKLGELKMKFLELCELTPFSMVNDQNKKLMEDMKTNTKPLKYISGKYFIKADKMYSSYFNLLKNKESKMFEVEDFDFQTEAENKDHEALNQLNFSYVFTQN